MTLGKPDSPLKKYPYIEHLLHEFDIYDYGMAGAGYFKFAPNYTQIVHRDGENFYNNGAETVEKKYKALCCINFILHSDTGVHFTVNNTKEKSEADPFYIYKSALLNVDNEHYVNTSDKERLLFKIQIYKPDFFTCVQKLKRLGL